MKRIRSQGDAQQRLESSIILIHGKPFFVERMRTENKGQGYFCDDKGNSESFDIKSESVNLCPPSLGYVNTDRGCFYLQRKPLRRVRQGLDTNNVTFVPNTDERWSVLISKDFDKAIRDEWPTLEQAEKQLERKRLVAIHKDIALSSDGRIYYKTLRIGSFRLESGKITYKIDDGWSYTLQPLEEVLGKCQ